ncbi:MAG: hypothetical protein N3I35_04575 [Clostridia bacterium]|nr:hypothetical protein [Clostridia bacterium]
MLNESSFTVRESGRREDSFYIDYSGVYRIADIANQAGIKNAEIKKIYIDNGGIYDESLDIYYFNNIDSAKTVIYEILKGMKPDARGRLLLLTEAEIEYIRQALINEGSNNLHLSNKVKDAIFKKLNR